MNGRGASLRAQMCRKCLRRMFHDYWTPSGGNYRVPLLKAKQYCGAHTSRGNRPYNEDKFKVGVLDKLAKNPTAQPFYFAVIDG
jgi:hypothetical protein